ncbi:hypothetical protein BJV78DRAFT_920170 [Lactifluus subvellereus]|nr:hypothetical protein BJV78DRAFT_920170 [Lactifluus subvellereus]
MKNYGKKRMLSTFLTKHHDEIFPIHILLANEVASVEGGRRLLWNILHLVSRLHRSGVVHGDICTHTVFVDFDFDCEELILGEFSEASSDMSWANEDCHQIFSTMKDYLGPIGSQLPLRRFGNEILDNMWQFSCSDSENWPYTVIELCQHLQLNPDRTVETWSTLSVVKELVIHHEPHPTQDGLSLPDVEVYAIMLTIQQAGSTATSHELQIHIRKTKEALKSVATGPMIRTL